MITAKRDGRVVYHWPASLKELVRERNKSRMVYSNKYYYLLSEAQTAAASWQLCACGSLCDAIPRDKQVLKYDGKLKRQLKGIEPVPYKAAPEDSQLRTLGYDFYSHIDNENFEEAEITLAEIEKRAGEVLFALGKKKKTYGKILKSA